MSKKNASSLQIEEIHDNQDGITEKNEIREWISNDEGLPSSSYESSNRESYFYNNTTNGYDRNRYDSYGTSAGASDFINLGVIHTNSPEETNEYLAKLANDIYKDPNTQIIRQTGNQSPVRYEQLIQIRYLQPPPVPPPGPLIIKEVRSPQPPQSPPSQLVIHEHPRRPPSPPPLILRERPPTPPPHIPSETIIRHLPLVPAPPPSLVIRRFAPLPEKPRKIIIERWLPYKFQSERQTIAQRAPPPIIHPEPRNQSVVYEGAEADITRRFEKLGVRQENPTDYVARYGTSLLDSAALRQQVRHFGVHEDISPPVSSASIHTNIWRNTVDYDLSNEMVNRHIYSSIDYL